MDFRPDTQAAKPIYLQIADELEARIRDNTIPCGTRLAAERKMSQSLGVARGTVKQAYAELERRGCLRILPASGAYVQEITKDVLSSEIKAVIEKLRQQSLSKWEIEALAKEAAWRNLPTDNRVRIAWIDCSPELLPPIAAQISKECYVDVTTFLLDEVMEAPALLAESKVDMFASTINHYDEMCSMLALLGYNNVLTERLVMSLNRQVVSTVATIAEDDNIAVFYSSVNFRRAIEMFLSEYGAIAHYCYYPLCYSMEGFTEALDRWDLVIVPPDTLDNGENIKKIRALCMERNIRMLPFESSVDYGSLLSLKERAQSCWLGLKQ